MKSIILSIFLVVSFAHEVQAQLDEYKYIVVPKIFDNFKQENQYKTSTLVKYLFTKKGYNTCYEDNLPEDLQANGCLGLFVNIDDQSTMFTTKTALVLKDCSKVVVFSTIQGKSKKKEYESSYAEAIRNAFLSIDAMPYNYEPKAQAEISDTVTVSFKNDVKELEESPNLYNSQDPLVEQEATQERQSYNDDRPVESDYKKGEETTPNIGGLVAVGGVQSSKSKDTLESSSSATMNDEMGVLYAQELSNGYQLVDSTPKIRMKLFKSSSPNVYVAESDTIKGVVYTKNDKWFFEYYKDDRLVTKELNIKF